VRVEAGRRCSRVLCGDLHEGASNDAPPTWGVMLCSASVPEEGVRVVRIWSMNERPMRLFSVALSQSFVAATRKACFVTSRSPSTGANAADMPAQIRGERDILIASMFRCSSNDAERE